VIVVIDALSSFSILILVASGLFVILGLMGVINLAHPGLMAIGAYGAFVATRSGINPWISIAVGASLAAGIGLVVELLLVRRLYERPLDTILATWGVALVIWQALFLIFGTSAFPYPGPVQGLLHVGDFSYSAYRLVLLFAGLAVALALAIVSRITTVGLIARAVMSNRELAQGVGLNTIGIRRWTFVLGSFLAGAAGALIAPLSPIGPFLGFGYLFAAFFVVLLAGRSVLGLLLAAAVLSGTQSIASLYANQIVAGVAIVLITVFILRLVPDGFDRLRRYA
jgi:branched-chain amino acid transport system permease protein